MTLAIIESGVDGIPVFYHELKSDFGFYRSKPDYPAYICLNKSLLETDENLHLAVYQTLLNYHNTLNTWHRLVPIVRYFKHLVPNWQEFMPEENPLKLTIIGRAVIRPRYWAFPGLSLTVSSIHIVEGRQAG